MRLQQSYAEQSQQMPPPGQAQGLSSLISQTADKPKGGELLPSVGQMPDTQVP